MAGCDSDINAFSYPPLFEDMRLSTKGGPLYRGARGGRATAAYYREREALIAAKNKYGSRYGRRIEAYKPDYHLWKSMRFIGCEAGSDAFEFTPGGLQKRKYSVQAELSSLTKSTSRQQDTVPLKCHSLDKTSSVIDNFKASPKMVDTNNFQAAALKSPSLRRRGVMRGRRMIDVSTISSRIGEKADTSPNGSVNIQKTEPGGAMKVDDEKTQNFASNNKYSSQLIKLVETMSIH